MLTPQNRLLLWVACVVIPLALLNGIDADRSQISALAVLFFLLAVAFDAFRAYRSRGKVVVQLPAILRISQSRSARIEVSLQAQDQKARKIRFALVLPREIQSEQHDVMVELPAGADWARLSWPIVALRRGSHRIETACVETTSPFGFWACRTLHPAALEIKVYPNLANERKHVAALFLNRGGIGLHAERQVGKGREFEKLREYVPGDGYDEIHWKATARRGRPITKVFQVERTQEVYVILDASRLSARRLEAAPPAVSGSAAFDSGRGECGATPLERFITSALVLGLAAEQQGDLFGLLSFSDRIDRFLRAHNGKNHYNACRDALYTLQPRSVTPDFDELSTFVRLRLRRRALLIFLISLDDPVLAGSFVRSIDLLCRQHLIMVNMIRPPGVVPVFSRPAMSTDDLYQHLAGHLQWQKLRTLEKVLHRRGVQFSLVENERLSADIVTQYLQVKRRQLL